MSLGKARIIADSGKIDADDLPSPVAFIPSRFPDVVDEERVYFERYSDDPKMAKLVRAATDADELVHLTIPAGWLTRPASLLLLEHASELLASRGRKKETRFTKSRAQMGRLAERLANHPGQVGTAVLRAIIEEENS